MLQHRLTHRPFRSWCPHCIRGKARAAQHRQSPNKGEESDIPKLVSDYFFVGQRRPANRLEREQIEAQAEKDGQTPIIILRDTKSRAMFAHVCPSKGAHEAVVDRLVGDLNTLGYKRILIRTDNEAAILDLWSKVRDKWHGEVVKVESSVGEHNTNADAEQTCQKVEDELRCWLDALNDSIGGKIPPTHDVMAWLVEHVTSIDRRISIGLDGKTPVERLRGRRGRDMMAEFGESVMFIPLRGNADDRRRQKADLEPRFMDGIFLGLTDRSDEILIWCQEGFRKARTMKRRPEGERWRRDELLSIRGTPLQPHPGSDDTRIRTRLEPGLADDRIIGDPVTKEDVSRELGTGTPSYENRCSISGAENRLHKRV